MLRKIVAILLSCSTVAFADGLIPIDFPEPIDVEQYRQILSDGFPQMNSSMSRRRGLEQLASDLELYRVDEIEGFNSRVLQNCTELISYELKINSEFRDEVIGPIRKSQEDARILAERQKCDVKYAEVSPYYELYYSFFNLYKEKSESTKFELEKCMSNDRCRLNG